MAAHLQACDACRSACEDLVGAADEQVVARAFAMAGVGAEFADRVLARLSDESGSQAPAATAAAQDDDEEIAELLAAGARYAERGSAGRSGMGMVIEYCSTCRERIDSADFRSGAAIQFKGQSYCAKCKGAILEEIEDDPEYIEQQRKAQRAGVRKSDRMEAIGSGIRQGIGRNVRREPPAARGGARGPNMAVIGGIAAGVLVLIVAAVFVMNNTPDAPSPHPDRGPRTAKRTDRGTRTSRGTTGTSGTGSSTPSTPETPAGPTMEQLMQLRATLKALRDARAEVQQFAQENSAPQQWRDVDLKWKNLLDDARWNDELVKGDAQVKELRAQIEADQRMSRDRFETEGNEVIGRAISRAQGFAVREMFGEAMQALDAVPPIYGELPKYKELAETREKINAMAAKAMGVLGEWFPVVSTVADIDKLKLPTNDPESTIHSEAGEQAIVVKTGSKPASVVFAPNSAGGWADYEIELECKAPAKAQLAVRVTRNRETGKLQGAAWTFDDATAADYHKFVVKIEGHELTATVDGEGKGKGNVDFPRGAPLLILPPESEIRIRTLRYRVLKMYGR